MNAVRSAFSSLADRLTAFAILSTAFVALRFCLFQQPLIPAATAVAAFAAVTGAGTSRLVRRRLDFHAYDGVVAADALAKGVRQRYALFIHAVACGIVVLCALIGRPPTLFLALIGYLVGAGSGHIARRAMPGDSVVRRPAGLRSIRALLQNPIAGGLAAILIVLPLFLLGSIERVPIVAFIGLASAVSALLLTMLDDSVVRFMTMSGYRAGRIIGLHARSLLVFLLLTVPTCLVLSYWLAAIVVGSVVLAALLLMAARILAYRVHAKRAADTVVTIGVAVACLTGVTMPMLLPFVVIAILWHLHRRSVSATWLLP